MPISSRVVINLTVVLLTVGLFALIGIVGMTVWLGEKARIYAEDATRARNTRVAGVELRAALQSAESSQRGYLLGGNEIYLAPYDAAKAEALAQFDRLKQLPPASAQNVAMLERLSTIVSEKIAEMDRSIGLKRELRDNEAATLF